MLTAVLTTVGAIMMIMGMMLVHEGYSKGFFRPSFLSDRRMIFAGYTLLMAGTIMVAWRIIPLIKFE